MNSLHLNNLHMNNFHMQISQILQATSYVVVFCHLYITLLFILAVDVSFGSYVYNLYHGINPELVLSSTAPFDITVEINQIAGIIY